MADRNLYNTVVYKLAGGTQPGPYGVPNDVLKHMPSEWHDLLHRIFQLAWITGRMPRGWKQSITVPLYKKGDPTTHQPITGQWG